jgi:hypothetical protein
MEALQLIALVSVGQACRRAGEALPEAPRVPYRPARRQDAVVRARRNARARLAGLLRRTADRVDPCPAPSAG